MASANRTKGTDIQAHRRNGQAPNGNGGPVLPVLSPLFGIAGLVCGYSVSWIAAIVLGIVAVTLGMIARRRGCSPAWTATLGVVLGGICIVASFALVAVVSFQMIRLGLA